jgi:hypothetical protein
MKTIALFIMLAATCLAVDAPAPEIKNGDRIDLSFKTGNAGDSGKIIEVAKDALIVLDSNGVETIKRASLPQAISSRIQWPVQLAPKISEAAAGPISKVKKPDGEIELWCTVTQVIPDGLLVQMVTNDSSAVITGYPKQVVDDTQLTVYVIPDGIYQYQSVLGATRTVGKYKFSRISTNVYHHEAY